MSQQNSESIFDQAGFEGSYEQPPADVPQIPAAPAYRKQGFSIYTVMLILSFAFLLIAAITLFIEAGTYQ